MLAEILFLSRQDLIGLGITMPEVIDVVEDAIRRQGAGEVLMPDKLALFWKQNANLIAMPAYVGARDALGIKWVGTVPANNDRDLPQTSALVILNDPQTAFPIAVLDGTWITAMRTGAVSAVAAKYLAPRDVKVLGLLGCGVQMRTQLLALTTVLKPEQVRVYDLRPAAMDAFVSQMSALVEAPIEPCSTPRDVVVGADVVVSATWLSTPPTPIVQDEWLKPGVLALPIDSDSIWDPRAYKRADKFLTDRWEPLKHFAEVGFFPEGLPQLYAELHEVVSGSKPGRESDDERIVAMNGGMAIEDVTMAKLAYERALRRGAGTRLPFISSPEEVFQF